jgi:hypothetical protein
LVFVWEVTFVLFNSMLQYVINRLMHAFLFISIESLYLSVIDTILCDKVCQWLVTGRWYSLGTLVSSTNNTDCYDITEILWEYGIKHHKPNTLFKSYILYLCVCDIYINFDFVRIIYLCRFESLYINKITNYKHLNHIYLL